MKRKQTNKTPLTLFDFITLFLYTTIKYILPGSTRKLNLYPIPLLITLIPHLFRLITTIKHLEHLVNYTQLSLLLLLLHSPRCRCIPRTNDFSREYIDLRSCTMAQHGIVQI